MSALLATLFLAATACDPAAADVRAAGGDACAAAWMDRTLRMNDIAAVGAHNAYKLAISEGELAAMTAVDPRAAGLDYAHRALAEQLDAGARQLEIDVLNDPQGGRYAHPLSALGRPGVGAREQATLLAWLEADPDHLRQYRQAKADQAALEPLKGAFADDLAALRSTRRTPVARRSILTGALAGGLVAAAVAAAVLVPMMTAAPEARLYESAPGRITDIALDDGSHMTLDAGSAVRVALGRDARRATLERGVAYFDIAHDTARPFQVAVADRRVIVTGTRFVTALTGDAAQVSLLQGRVAISTRDVGAKDALDDALILSPGERADFRAGQPGVRKANADVDMATAWHQRRLVFQDAPLSQVIASAARYGDHPLILTDPALGRTRVTVVLPLEGAEPLEQRLTALLPIRIETADDGRRIVRRE